MRHYVYKLIRLIKSEFDIFIYFIDRYSKLNPYTKFYSIGKTLLATSLLLTLVFNEIPTLFVESIYKQSGNVFVHKINLFTFFEYKSLWIPKLISIVILIFTISGYFPQLFGLLLWWVSFSFFTSAVIVDGGDQIIVVVSLLMIPISLLDNRLNSWSNNKSYKLNHPAKNLVAWMFFFFIEIQGAFLYFQASVEKPYKLEEWRDGTALYYWFNNNVFGPAQWILDIFNPILANPYLAFLITWGAIFLELALFGAFFLPPKRRVRLFVVAILFHLSIFFFQGLASFFFSIAGLLCIYLMNRYEANRVFESYDSNISRENDKAVVS